MPVHWLGFSLHFCHAKEGLHHRSQLRSKSGRRVDVLLPRILVGITKQHLGREILGFNKVAGEGIQQPPGGAHYH